MDRQRWDQIEELFHAALQLPAADRDSFLADRCQSDTGLRQKVQSLLNQETGTQGPNQPMLAPNLGQEVRSLLNQVAGEFPTESMAVPGTAVGPYQIEGLLGKGGMGEVFRARDTRLGRPVALKFLSDTLAANIAVLERFRREAQAISTLNHPNVCTVYDIGEQSGRPYLVMELMEGQTLKDRIAAGSISNSQLLGLILPILEALEAAHAAGIIHRDIKPANIFITQRGVVKILDFGLAKSTADRSALTDTLTTPGTTMGTISYMAPEQARGQNVDARSDLFSCGVMMYQMATGSLPFAGDSWAATVDALLNRAPRPPRELRPDLLPEIERVVYRALRKDPAQRYQSAAGMRADLLRAQQLVDPQTASPIGLPRASRYGKTAAAAALLVLGAIWLLTAHKTPVTSTSEYVQLTDFSDSASAPAISPDGRMVAFFRGGKQFLTKSQLYVKVLPNGQSTQLTNDELPKYNPVFTPDGSRIAYTAIDRPASSWDTWTVPVTGGSPTRLMRNAAGLSWTRSGAILFSEIMSGTALHMGIVTAQESRTGERSIYFPDHERAMAHYSYPSHDEKSLLVVEMDGATAWLPCRLLPMAGGGKGPQVGPPGACTAAAWSPDGKWMYFNAADRGATHLWRQRFPDGKPEQITFGPSEEQGLAMSPDGKFVISSVGIRKSAVWLHDSSGERQISPEGSADFPQLSGDGKRVYYLLYKTSSGVREMWSTDAAGKSDAALPGVAMADFQVSPNGQQVAFSAGSGLQAQIFVAPLDGSGPPRLVVPGGDELKFESPGTLLFRQLGSQANHLARIKIDGSGLERVLEPAIVDFQQVSADGKWVIVSGGGGFWQKATVAVSLKDQSHRIICQGLCLAGWSGNGAYFYVTVNPDASNSGLTKVFAVPPGADLPVLPAAGLVPTDVAAQPGPDSINQGSVRLGLDPRTYVFVKSEFVGNLFRIPLH